MCLPAKNRYGADQVDRRLALRRVLASGPRNRLFQPVIAPEHLTPHNEGGRAKAARPTRDISLRSVKRLDLRLVSSRQDMLRIATQRRDNRLEGSRGTDGHPI